MARTEEGRQRRARLIAESGARVGRPSPSRGFLIGIGGVVLFALALALVGAIGAQSPADSAMPVPAESPIPAEITVVPPPVTPAPDFARLPR